MSLKAVFFDIDGVIVLSEPLHQEKTIMIARDPLRTGAFDPVHGVAIDTKTDWPNELAGIGDHRIHEWIQKKNPAFPLTEKQFLAAGEQYYLENADRLKVRPSFHEAFDHFTQAARLPVAAVSSGVRSQVDRNLEAAGVADRVLFSESADDVEPGKTKPHPAPYLNALKKLNARLRALNPGHTDIRPEECLVVEDSGSGVAAGHAAGMKTVHWTLEPGQKHHDAADYKLGPADSLLTLAQALTAAAPGVAARPIRRRGLTI